MGVYIALYIVMLIFSVLEESDAVVRIGKREVPIRIIAFIVIFIMILLIAVLRGEMYGKDQPQYKKNYFRKYQDISFAETFTIHRDVGFTMLTWFIDKFIKRFWVYRAILFVLTFVPTSALIYKHSKNVSFSFLMFVALGIFGLYCVALRQAVAFAIVFWAYYPLIRRQPIRFILIVTLAGMFHKTAFIMLLLYPLAARNPHTRKILRLIYLVGSVAGFPVLFRIIGGLYKGGSYLDDMQFGGGTGILSYFAILIGLSLVCIVRDKSNTDNHLEVPFDVALGTVYLQLCTLYFPMFSRTVLYAAGYLAVFIPERIRQITDKKEKYILFAVFILMISLLYFRQFDNYAMSNYYTIFSDGTV